MFFFGGTRHHVSSHSLLFHGIEICIEITTRFIFRVRVKNKILYNLFAINDIMCSFIANKTNKLIFEVVN